jgi:hypothetical protein
MLGGPGGIGESRDTGVGAPSNAPITASTPIRINSDWQTRFAHGGIAIISMTK